MDIQRFHLLTTAINAIGRALDACVEAQDACIKAGIKINIVEAVLSAQKLATDKFIALIQSVSASVASSELDIFYSKKQLTTR